MYPLVTRTKQLLKLESLKVKLDTAAPYTYTAPPPPLAAPGRTEDGWVTAEHSEKLELVIVTDKFEPVVFKERGGVFEIRG